jgi:hypothetical protein
MSALLRRRPGPAFGAASKPPAPELQPPAADAETKTETLPPPPVGLMSLPTELHIAISKCLIYPDALSLKHTSRHWYSLVCTDIELKVDWLIERRRLHLECPNDRRCDFGSDLRFCRGSVP